LIYSLLPPLIAIILAILTRRLIPSLLVALWVGGFLIARAMQDVSLDKRLALQISSTIERDQ